MDARAHALVGRGKLEGLQDATGKALLFGLEKSNWGNGRLEITNLSIVDAKADVVVGQIAGDIDVVVKGRIAFKTSIDIEEGDLNSDLTNATAKMGETDGIGYDLDGAFALRKNYKNIDFSASVFTENNSNSGQMTYEQNGREISAKDAYKFSSKRGGFEFRVGSKNKKYSCAVGKSSTKFNQRFSLLGFSVPDETVETEDKFDETYLNCQAKF